ncbi:MAG: phosphodiester glycosidase family protein [Clostridia bacterium]|nr:phosphodiester glycosidase family protein [Clostridia bacterium]
MKKIIFVFVITLLIISLLSPCAFAATPANSVLSQTTLNTTKTLADGVTYTQSTAAAGTKYGGTKGIEFNIVEADLSTKNLYLNSVYGGSNASHAYKTGTSIVNSFDKANPALTPVAAINADLWWIYTGSATEPYNSNKKLFAEGGSFSTSLGFTMSCGEIYTSDRMPQEHFVTNSAVLGYSDQISFGITSDFVPVISNPNAEVIIKNTTRNTSATADGINRLPAYNTLVMYTDKGPKNIYANDDAFEVKIKIDSTSDYVIKHGTDISGTVETIYAPGAGAPTMSTNSNYIILTARGSRLNSISSYKVGDKVNIKVSIYDQYGKYTKQWQKVTDAISGHIPFATDGTASPVGIENNYPATLIGINNSGNVVMITYGATSNGSRRGVPGSLFDDIAKELDLKDAFTLDGGGSATMILKQNTNYSVVNHPSDSAGERQILNMLILSVGGERCAQGDIPAVPDKTKDASVIDFSNPANIAYVNGPVNDTNFNVSNDTLKLVSGSGFDPYVTVNYGLASPRISTSKYKYLTIEYMLPVSNSQKSPTGQIFYQVGSNINADPAYCLNTAKMTRDGEYHKLTIDFSNAKGWTGFINSLRFDFFNSCAAGDTMYIKALTLSGSLPTVEVTPTATPTIEPTKTTAPTPAKTPTAIPTQSPTATELLTPTATKAPTASQAPIPTETPNISNSAAPTIEATANVTEPTQTAADAGTSKNSESPLFIAFIIFDLLAVIALVVLLVVYKRKKK